MSKGNSGEDMALSVVHVIVVNYESSEYVRRLLDSLEAGDRDCPVYFHVLENGSSPQDAENLTKIIGDFRGEIETFVTYSDTNLGFGGGVNKLLRSIRYEPDHVLWILNPDTLVLKDSLIRLKAEVGEDRAVSPLILQGDTNCIWFAGGEIDIRSGRTIHENFGCEMETLFDENPNRAPISTQFLTGAAPMLLAGTWKKVGEFWEELFLYWEDADWSLRAFDKNVKMLVVPQSVIRHSQGGSSGGGDGYSETFYYYVARNRFLICARFIPKFRLLFGSGFIETVKTLARPVLKEREYRLRKAASAAKGIFDGLRGRAGVRSYGRLAQAKKGNPSD